MDTCTQKGSLMARKEYRRELYLKMRVAYKYGTRWDDKLVVSLTEDEYDLLQTALLAIKNLNATIQPPPPTPDAS